MKFGLSPADRERVSIVEEKVENKWEYIDRRFKNEQR